MKKKYIVARKTKSRKQHSYAWFSSGFVVVDSVYTQPPSVCEPYGIRDSILEELFIPFH
jgi:hypothetical protein